MFIHDVRLYNLYVSKLKALPWCFKSLKMWLVIKSNALIINRRTHSFIPSEQLYYCNLSAETEEACRSQQTKMILLVIILRSAEYKTFLLFPKLSKNKTLVCSLQFFWLSLICKFISYRKIRERELFV